MLSYNSNSNSKTINSTPTPFPNSPPPGSTPFPNSPPPGSIPMTPPPDVSILPGIYTPTNIILNNGDYDKEKSEEKNQNRDFYVLVKNNGSIELTADNIYFCEKRKLRCSFNINKQNYDINQNQNKFSIIESKYNNSFVMKIKNSDRIFGKSANVTFFLNPIEEGIYIANMNNIELSTGNYDAEETIDRNEGKNFFININKNGIIKLTADNIFICGNINNLLPSICLNSINKNNYDISQDPEKFIIESISNTNIIITISGFKIGNINQQVTITFDISENNPINSPIEPPPINNLIPGLYIPDMDNVNLGNITYDADLTNENNNGKDFYANVDDDGIITLTADEIKFCGKISFTSMCSDPLNVDCLNIDENPDEFIVDYESNKSFILSIIGKNIAYVTFNYIEI